jgi:hypothetical protein
MTMDAVRLVDQFVRQEGAYGGPDNGMAFTGLQYEIPGQPTPAVERYFGWHAYIPYAANTDSDACFAWVTADSLGSPSHWGVHGLAPQSEHAIGSIGYQENFRLMGYGTGNAVGLGGADLPVWAHFAGYMRGGVDPITLQLWAGRMSNTGSLIIEPGAWLAVGLLLP